MSLFQKTSPCKEPAPPLTKGRMGGVPNLCRAVPEGSSTMVGLDVSAPRTAAEKSAQLITAAMKSVEQAKQLENPDARVVFDNLERSKYLSEYANSYLGLGTGDFDKFARYFWDFPSKPLNWSWLQAVLLYPKPISMFWKGNIWRWGTL